jgi:hypothetical protein
MNSTRLIAFYLPQFHPIPENDRWWGKGFTEWTNVARAEPQFPGHHQPQLPADLGFYDLRVPEVRAQQAELARHYGIHGFCYYYYWFNGRRLLERPLDEVLRSGEPDFPFCICWANENWTRRWDGAENEVLMQQEHSPASDEAFIRDVLPLLKDPRYIRVDGAPLLLVYRPAILPTPVQTTEIWRTIARNEGISRLHLAAVHSFGLGDPRPLGFDSGVEFPPHNIAASEITRQVKGLAHGFEGKVYDFREFAQNAIANTVPWPRFRGVMTAWDNTARRGNASHIFRYSSPREYEVWLRTIIAETEARPESERVVFINAWNEWAEGTHLEPDQKFGHAYLEATARALRGRADWREVVRVVREQPELPASALRGFVEDLEFALESRERSLDYLRRIQGVMERVVNDEQLATFREVEELRGKARGAGAGGLIHLDRVQGIPPPEVVRVDRHSRVTIEGWSFAPGIPANGGRQGWLMLRALSGRSRSWFAPLMHRFQRDDVVKHFGKVDRRFTEHAGFKAVLACEELIPGEYELGALHMVQSKAVAGFASQRLQVY